MNEAFNECIKDLAVEAFLNCSEKCTQKEGSTLTVSVPEDKLTEAITETVRKQVYELLSSDEFVEKLSKAISEKEGRIFEGNLVRDMNGLILIFKEKGA